MGYCSEENLAYLSEPESPNALVATKKDHKQRNDTEPPTEWSHSQRFQIEGSHGPQAQDNGWACSLRHEILHR